MGDTTTTSLIS
uniref:Uncharacterized protein n=1 Tax=Arundo donax TaxID=35708 RepID=A0A0A9GQ42_ARUDO